MQHIWSEPPVATFLIRCAIDDTADLRPAQCTGTHRARLYSYIKRTILQVLTAQLIGSRSDGLHLSMRRHVIQRLGQVVSPGNDTSFAGDNGTNRYLASQLCLLCFGQCHRHQALICFLLFILCHVAKVRISERKAKENTKFFHFAFPNESTFDEGQWYEKTGKRQVFSFLFRIFAVVIRQSSQKAINLFYHGTAQRNG